MPASVISSRTHVTLQCAAPSHPTDEPLGFYNVRYPVTAQQCTVSVDNNFPIGTAQSGARRGRRLEGLERPIDISVQVAWATRGPPEDHHWC